MNDLRGKRALVTGASAGIGYVTSRELARMGADVVMHVRDEGRGEAARAQIARETGSENTDLLVSDFTDLFSVCGIANDFARRYDNLDILVLNAAAIFPQRAISEHGNELTFQVNHLAHFMLWRVLQPMLWASRPSRIVHVSSDAHYAARRGICFDDLTCADRWSPFAAYAHSKLANIMFCLAQSRKIRSRGVTSNVVHPGLVRTKLATDAYGRFGGPVLDRLTPVMARTPESGADTVVWLAASPAVEGVTGTYFHNRRPHRSSAASIDEEAQARLWSISVDLAGCGCLKCPQSE